MATGDADKPKQPALAPLDTRTRYPSAHTCRYCHGRIDSATTAKLALTRVFCSNDCCGRDRRDRRKAEAAVREHQCSKCGEVKQRLLFGSRARGGKRSRCKACTGDD